MTETPQDDDSPDGETPEPDTSPDPTLSGDILPAPAPEKDTSPAPLSSPEPSPWQQVDPPPGDGQHAWAIASYEELTTTSPFPPASELAKYAEVDPQAPEIIFREFQRNSEHLREIQRLQVSAAIQQNEVKDRDRRLGMNIGAALVLVLVVGGVYLLATDHYVAGTLVSLPGVGVVLRAFVVTPKA